VNNVFQTRLIVYSELLKVNAKNLMWSGDILTQSNHDILRDSLAIALQIEGLHRNDLLWDAASNKITELSWNIFNEWSRNAYLIYLDHCPELRNRVRSYKGMFWKHSTIEPRDFIQQELPVGEAYSSFCSVIRATPNNWPVICGLASSSNSLLVVSPIEDLSVIASGAFTFVNEKVDLQNPDIIYSEAVPYFIDLKAAVAGFAYDAGYDNFLNFHVYFHKRDLSSLPLFIRQFIPELAWQSSVHDLPLNYHGDN